MIAPNKKYVLIDYYERGKYIWKEVNI